MSYEYCSSSFPSRVSLDKPLTMAMMIRSVASFGSGVNQPVGKGARGPGLPKEQLVLQRPRRGGRERHGIMGMAGWSFLSPGKFSKSHGNGNACGWFLGVGQNNTHLFLAWSNGYLPFISSLARWIGSIHHLCIGKASRSGGESVGWLTGVNI